jgi:hypothetical protein
MGFKSPLSTLKSSNLQFSTSLGSIMWHSKKKKKFNFILFNLINKKIENILLIHIIIRFKIKAKFQFFFSDFLITKSFSFNK